MSGRLLFDLTHTSHTRARTGIQRVVRSLHRELGERAVPVTHDPYLGAWREIEPWERANLASDQASAKRGVTWPLGVQLRGRWRHAIGSGQTFSASADVAGFLTAELFSPSMVFHGLRVGFRVGEDVAFMINDGGAGAGRLSLLRGNVLQGMLVVNLDSMSE